MAPALEQTITIVNNSGKIIKTVRIILRALESLD